MSPDQKWQIQSTFIKLLPKASTLADTFYSCLFQLDPSLRRHLGGGIGEHHRRMIMEMFTFAALGLDRMSDMLPAIADLGSRYGSDFLEKDYDTVKTALLWTLETQLNAGFTPQAKSAWEALYSLLARTMRSAVDVKYIA
jgi:methyl-accepting chemotaxis protein